MVFFRESQVKERKMLTMLVSSPRTAGGWTEFCGEEHLTSVIILKSNSTHREVDEIQKMRSKVSQM